MKKGTLVNNVVTCVAVAIAYMALSMPFISLYFSSGGAQLRFSGFVPMVSGLLLGPIAGVGCALGNLLVDLAGTYDAADVFGSIGVFVMAYLPYKLWHGLLRGGKNTPEFIGSVTSVLKYVFIAFICSVCATMIPAIGGQLFSLFNLTGFFVEVFLQYFDLTMFLGMMFLQLITQYTKIEPHIPQKAYENEHFPKRYTADYILSGGIVLLGAALLGLTAGEGLQTTELVRALCILELVLIAALVLLPMTRGGKKVADAPQYKPVKGIHGQFITGFLAMLCVLLVLFTRAMVVNISYETQVGLWIEVLLTVATASVIMLCILALILKWIERHVIDPICITSSYAGRFVSAESLLEEDLELPKAGNELDDLGEAVRQMATDMREYVRELKEKTTAEERSAAEMNVAKGIQMSLLPKAWSADSFEIAARIKPARAVGGDFYDILELSKNRVFLAIADVSGKGVSAALFMMRAKTLMKARLDLSLSKMVEQLNEELSACNDTMMFVTLFVCVVDKEAMSFTYVNAGHNAPVVLNEGRLEMLQTQPDFVAGPLSGTAYTEHSMAICDDFRLLLYTDGVTEAQDEQGGFYGNDRLIAAVEGALDAKLTAQETLCELQKSVEDFAGNAEQSDDITMLCANLRS